MVAATGVFAALARDAGTIGLHLTDTQTQECARLAADLAEATRTVNLTAITDPEGIAVRHFLDSFTAHAVRAWTGRERVVDVGSGAGFPGLALRIAMPSLVLTCVEATGKKARAIERFRDLLGLHGVAVENARAEDLARVGAHRARYDVATARALGTLGLCVELCLPFLRVGGDLVVWKGRIDAEMPGARKALAAMGGEIASVVTTAQLGLADRLPGRQLVLVRKTRPTPERYPRTPADMKRRPW